MDMQDFKVKCLSRDCPAKKYCQRFQERVALDDSKYGNFIMICNEGNGFKYKVKKEKV